MYRGGSRNVDQDQFDELYRRINKLEDEVKSLRNQRTLTTSIYDPANFPQDSVIGQIAIGNDGSFWIYGQDAIWHPVTGIRFNIDNEGGWLYVQTNNTVDLDTLPDPCAVGGIWGAAFEDASGDGTVIASTTLVRIKSGGQIELDCATSPMTFIVNGKVFEFHDDGTVHIPVGGGVVADTV